MQRLITFILPTLFFSFLFWSCAYGPPPDGLQKNESNLTPGMITTKLEPGESSKAQVMETFGPPDLITKEDGIEMWGYDKISRESAYNSFGIGIGGGGLPGAGLVFGGVSAKQGYSSQTTKTVFLLVYFKNDIVLDYKLSATKF